MSIQALTHPKLGANLNPSPNSKQVVGQGAALNVEVAGYAREARVTTLHSGVLLHFNRYQQLAVEELRDLGKAWQSSEGRLL